MANNFDYGMAFGNHLVHETSKLCYADRVVLFDISPTLYDRTRSPRPGGRSQG